MKVIVATVALVLSSCALVQGDEPEQQSVVFVQLLPGHLQSYSESPAHISVRLEGDVADTFPVREVLKTIDLVDLRTSERVGLEPIATPQDETYRGAEFTWFALPQLDDGEYELAVTFAEEQKKLVAGSSFSDNGVWRSRFRVDHRSFFLNSVSLCDKKRIFVHFSEPVLSFAAEQIATRLVVLGKQGELPCKASNVDGELVGGSTLELDCEGEVRPTKVLFSESLRAAEGDRWLSSRSMPGELLNEVVLDKQLDIYAEDCVGWAVP